MFQIGNVNCTESFKKSLISILDYGLKYIPTYNLDLHSYFSQLIFTLESNMINLNKQFFLKQEKLDKIRFYESLNKTCSNLVNSLDNTSNMYGNFNEINENTEDITSEIINPFNDFFEYKKKEISKNKLNKLNISEDCFKFQLELYKQLENVKFDFQSNLKKGELTIIKKFLKEKPFKIVNLDKNVGTGIISDELYDELVLESLNDPETYEEIFENPLVDCKNNIEIQLNELFLDKKISNKLHNYLKDCPNKLGTFSISPKIHKKKYGNRPIISYINHFTNNLCIFLDFLLSLT